ncbi:MAG: FlgD immunoglobulin-like domain containing protein [candidate division WOR-3 bacterium]
MAKHILVLTSCLLTLLARPHNIMIDHNEIPLVIDTYARYKQNQSVFRWTPFDSTRTHWNLTQYPQQLTTRTGLRDYTEGWYPAPDTMENDYPDPEVVEMDTLGSGTEQYCYLWLDSFALYSDGIDFETGGYRFIGNYRPDGEVYSLPMYYGGSWITAWSWQYEIIPGIPYVANEQHEKAIVAKGKVKVPMSGEYYWPCLVIRDYMTYSDNMGTLDRRWIYEWVVPGHFAGGNGVAAAMSQNGAARNFVNVEQMLQVERCSVPGWDLLPPRFANTRVWRDTVFNGPFVVWSDITDNEELGEESLFYRLNQGNWVSVPPDSESDGRFYFTIPAVTQPTRIDYYLWAMDEFSADNDIEFWTTWPVCSPESTMITFIAGGSGAGEQPAVVSREASLAVFPSPFRTSVTFRISQPAFPYAACRIYSQDGSLVRTLVMEPCNNGNLQTIWDGRNEHGRTLPGGTYLYRISAPGWQRSGIVTRLGQGQ